MFCFQCEQTARDATSAGCAGPRGVCGKDEAVADLQDVLVHQIKGLAQLRKALAGLGGAAPEADDFVLFGLFTTLTNVNFNRARFVELIGQASQLRETLLAACTARDPAFTPPEGAARFVATTTLPEMLAQAPGVGVRAGLEQVGEDIVGLRALVLYGLKGVAAYAHHAAVLGQHRAAVADGIADALALLGGNCADAGTLLEAALALGQTNFVAMEALDAANTGRFGSPTPQAVRISPVAGKAILVSGHDLGDLEDILKATAGTGINVYTHGELLPANGYPKLRAYPHLVGNYGGAWQNQQTEFAAFPGAVVLTSNCLITPQPTYRNRLFTTGPVGWPGVPHIANGDYSRVIAAARALPGFAEDAEPRSITVGFGREAVLGVAGQVIEAVKSGALKHFFLIGGCDGAAPGRNYYTEFAEALPQDTMILTLGCGKYRFNTHDFGTVAGLPRLLDIGQCNDSYSALVIAKALAEAFGCGINDLPLSLIISWFEQKAAAVLLTLLALGVRKIRLGPTLPAFLTPALVAALVEKFELQPITTPEADIAACLAA